METTVTPFSSQEIYPATDEDVLSYLRRSSRFAEIAALAEQDALVVQTCEQLNITVSDQEWQAAGDAFRQQHRLLGAQETFAWLAQQRISAEDWSQGIRIRLLTAKLKEHLFGANVDGYYVLNRDQYQRVALSQILVTDLTEALNLVETLKQNNALFCALALEHSKGKLSQQNGGFAGVKFLVELLPEVAQAIAVAPEGSIIGPIQTRLGYHILKVEKWYPIELTMAVREYILDGFFQRWLQEVKTANH